MGKKYTADDFVGAVTGTASGNVAKTGDTMTGTLSNTATDTITRINNTNPQTVAEIYTAKMLVYLEILI